MKLPLGYQSVKVANLAPGNQVWLNELKNDEPYAYGPYQVVENTSVLRLRDKGGYEFNQNTLDNLVLPVLPELIAANLMDHMYIYTIARLACEDNPTADESLKLVRASDQLRRTIVTILGALGLDIDV